MNSIARLTLLCLVAGLSACTVHQPSEPTAPPIQTLPPVPSSKPAPKPGAVPSKPTVTPAPKPVQRTSPSFAPPPGGASHWDPRLGVYVLDGKSNTFYRQRTYYRWNNGWSWSTNLNGPWQETDSSGVPGGLGRAFGQ